MQQSGWAGMLVLHPVKVWGCCITPGPGGTFGTAVPPQDKGNSPLSCIMQQPQSEGVLRSAPSHETVKNVQELLCKGDMIQHNLWDLALPHTPCLPSRTLSIHNLYSPTSTLAELTHHRPTCLCSQGGWIWPLPASISP